MRAPDVVIVGGGMVGTSAARHLARAGAAVLLLESRRIGDGAPSAAAGMVGPFLPVDADPAWYRLRRHASAAYPGLAAELRDETGLDVEYRACGTLRVAETAAERKTLTAAAAVARDDGMRAEWLDLPTARELVPGLSESLAGVVWTPDAAHVRGNLVARAQAMAAARRGAAIREQTPVLAIERRGDRVVGVRTPDGPVSAGRVLLAAGAWTGTLTADSPAPVAVRPVKGQSLVAEAPAGWLRHLVTGSAGTLLTRADGSVYVGATVEEAGFDERPTLGAVADRVTSTARLIPAVTGLAFREVKTGLRPAPASGEAPTVGAYPGTGGLFVATGLYRLGVLLGPLTGRLVAELMLRGTADDPAADLLRAVGAELLAA